MSDRQDVVLVGVDDSPSSRAAIRWAAEYARVTSSRLQAVRVLDWPIVSEVHSYLVMADEVYSNGVQLEDRYRAPMEAAFNEVRPEPGWRMQFARGHAGRILVELSRDARLLVLGARERRGINRLLDSGSVGDYCLNHASCPVIAIPRETPAVRSPASAGPYDALSARAEAVRV